MFFQNHKLKEKKRKIRKKEKKSYNPRIDNSKIWFCKKTNKRGHKFLARQKKKQKTHTISAENVNITSVPRIKNCKKTCHVQRQASNIFINKMDYSLGNYVLLKLAQGKGKKGTAQQSLNGY